MSLVHTRTDHPELLMCLVPPRNPERRKRMLESFKRRDPIAAKPPQMKSKEEIRSAFYRMCRQINHEPICSPIWATWGSRVGSTVISFTYGFDDEFEAPKRNLRQIMDEVSHKYGVSVHDIKSKCRAYAIIPARQEFFYRARAETCHSYPSIAKYCGGRDHTTALHGVRKHCQKHGLAFPGEAQ